MDDEEYKPSGICSSESSIDFQLTTRHIPEDSTLHSHHCENLRSYRMDDIRRHVTSMIKIWYAQNIWSKKGSHEKLTLGWDIKVRRNRGLDYVVQDMFQSPAYVNVSCHLTAKVPSFESILVHCISWLSPFLVPPENCCMVQWNRPLPLPAYMRRQTNIKPRQWRDFETTYVHG
jgi:hypothetical protein